MSYHFVVRTSPVAQKRKASLPIRQALFATLYGTKPAPSSGVSLRPICGRSWHSHDLSRKLRRVCVEVYLRGFETVKEVDTRLIDVLYQVVYKRSRFSLASEYKCR